ncbi:hypothetical protein [Methylocystis sp. ATCC 49242]|uniref:hypothetical protein n=2 Tax=unclassified Methylocystis TaxID=2625913 RepID=UPI0001F87C34|nr:hypothetical protein [Methylocystis sp. ATCC 49242]
MPILTTANDHTQNERKYHAIRNEGSAGLKTLIDSVLHDMSVIDSKSADLLQFISVMLAALTFSLGLIDEGTPYGHYIKVAIFAFMAAFASAAWIDLRCLNMMGPDAEIGAKTIAEFENDLLMEISKRRNTYLLSLHITKVAFSLLLPLVMIWIFLVDKSFH